MQPQRHSYAPEYCFGGMIQYDKQPVTSDDDLRASAALGDGRPNQRKVIRYYPVLPESVEVFVGGEMWQGVPDIQAATGHVYQLDAATGELRFGDGTHGAAPAQNALITASYRARRAGFVDYYSAMKAVDADIRIFAGFESPNIIREMGDKNLYDGIVVHPYTNDYNVPKARTLDEWHHNLMLSSARLGREVQAYQDLIDKTVAPSRRGQVRVICTEYGPNRQDQTLPEGTANRGTYRFLSTGLYDATQLMHWMRIGVPHAQRHATTVGVFGPSPEFEMTASARAFQLFTHHFGDRLIGLQIDNNPLRPTNNFETHTPYYSGYIKRIGDANMPADAQRLQLPRLEAEAGRDANGGVYLMAVNQDATDNVTASIQIVGFAGGDAAIQTLTGTTATGTSYKISESRERTIAGALSHTFPAHSLTAIKFSADRK